MTPSDARSPRGAVGVALLVAAAALVVAALAEFAPGVVRGNGDDPAESVAYLREAGRFYGYSGVGLVAGGASLVVGALGVARLARPGGLSLAFAAATAFGVLAGGFLAVAGVLRLNATGTVLHIDDLDPGWGESAYLAVQLAGTQGLLATGMIGLSGWLVGTALLGIRRRLPGLAAVGIPAAAVLGFLTLDALMPLAVPDGLFLAYVAAITIGLPLGLAATGATVLVPAAARRLAGGED